MPRSKRLRALRKSVRREYLDSLATISDDDLLNLQKELGRELSQQATVLNEIRSRMEAAKLERKRRESVTSVGIHISEHAVVRYLERVKGMDIAAVREEIASLAMLNAKEGSSDRYARRSCADTNIVLGLNEVDGTVTTVFTDDESEMLDVPSD